MIEIIQKKTADYFKPSPIFWRKIGDSLLGISAFVVTFGIQTDANWIAYTALAIGVIGKFLTNFFTDD